MKIGIITIHNSPNYGACLQAYALWKYINDLGHDVEIIDLYRPYQKEYIRSKKFKPYRQTLKFRAQVSLILKNLGLKKYTGKHSDIALKKFERFNSSISFSKPYFSIDDLYADPPIYDLYICGSDQLWNPTQPYCVEPYFLTFAPRDKKKISYATSIGVTSLPSNVKEDYKKWLEEFDAISVRERQGKELLESFIDNKVVQVADPTFLIKQSVWKSMAKRPSIQEPYILLFALRHDQGLLDHAMRLSEESKIKLIYLCQEVDSRIEENCLVVNDAGIEEFLGYIEYADMVLTKSFHGTVFSLLLGAKNFFTYISSNNKRGSRIEDLLYMFELSNHILRDYKLGYGDMVKLNVDSSKCLSIVEYQRSIAVDFLSQFI